MTNKAIIKELSEINAMAKILEQKSQQLMAKLGSENGSSPALRKKSGLSEEDKLKARERRTRLIQRKTA